jgi:hypothetical protein
MYTVKNACFIECPRHTLALTLRHAQGATRRISRGPPRTSHYFNRNLPDKKAAAKLFYFFLALPLGTAGHARCGEKASVKSLGSSSFGATVALSIFELNSMITACILASSLSLHRDENTGDRSICFTL